MIWRKITELNDLITYEKSAEGVIIRLEARLDEDAGWSIFKSYSFDESNLVEEYTASSRGDVLILLKSLMKERDHSRDELVSIKKKQNRKIEVDIKRSHKELDTEKWFFHINKEKTRNFFVVYYGKEVQVDVVMHESYKHHEDKVVDEIVNLLGLLKFDDEVKIEIYYFNNTSSKRRSSEEKAKLMGEIEIGLGMDEDK